jgi:hypothetical protein
MSADSPTLNVYIAYEYLAAQQFGELLLGLQGVYDELLYADAPFLRQLPSAPAARLRIETIETGNSVTVYLAHGITQLVGSADPSLVRAAGGVAALTATGTLIMRLFHRAEDLRAKFLRDSRANEREQIEIASKKLDLAGKARELGASAAEIEQIRQASLAEVTTALAEQAPGRPPAQQDALAERLMPYLETIARIVADENIREVRITPPDPAPGPTANPSHLPPAGR